MKQKMHTKTTKVMHPKRYVHLTSPNRPANPRMEKAREEFEALFRPQMVQCGNRL